MKACRKPSAPPEKLRSRAEKLLGTPRREVAQMPVEDVQKLVHELQVHQIELEMQNDELRRTQLELEQALDRYADLYNFAPVAHLTLNAEGEILEANLNAGKLLGLERGRLIHQKFARFVAAGARDAFYLFCRQVFSADVSQSAELELVDTQARRLVVLVEAVREATSPPQQGRFSFIDITERKRLEQSLRQLNETLEQRVAERTAALHASEERHRALFEQAADAIVVFDPQTLAVLDFNNEAGRRLGYTRAEFARLKVSDFEVIESAAKIKRHVQQIVRQGDTVFETRHRTKSSAVLDIEVRSRSIQIGDQVLIHGIWRDITERKRAELALRATEARLQEAQRIGRIGSWSWEPAKNIVWWSDESYELFGLDPAVVRPSHQRFLKLLHPDDRKLVQQRIKALMAGEDFYQHDFRVVRPDGFTLWLHSRAKPTRDAAGRLVRLEGTDQDITERKLMEQALRQLNETLEQRVAERTAALTETQAELQQAQRIAHLGSWYWDAKTDLVTGSEQLARMYGVAPETQLPFNKLKELFFPAKDWDRINQAVQETLRTGVGYELDVESLRDGKTIWVTTRAEPVRDAGGTIIGLRGTVQDITERKQAEIGLNEKTAALAIANTRLSSSEQKLRGLYELSPLGIALTDMQGRYLEFNEAFRVMCDYPAEELKQLDYWKLTPKMYEPEEARQLESLRQTGRYGPYEKHYRRRDGTLIPISLNGMVITDAAGQSRIWSIVEDITERKRAEEKLKLFQSLVNQSSDSIEIIDPKTGDFLDVNEGACTSLGYSREELLSLRISDIDPLADPSTFAKSIEALRKSDSRPWVGLHRRKDGTTFPVEVSRKLVQLDRTYLVAVARDITERKRAEKELQERADNYFGLFNAVQQAIYIQNPDLTFIDVNQGAVEMYGYQKEYFIGKTPEFLAAPGKNDLNQVAAWVEQAFHGHPQKYEFWGQRKDGTIFPKDVWTVKGKYFGKDVLITVATDITDRMQAEAALRESEATLRMILESTPVGLVVIDDETHTIAEVNPIALELIGASKENIVGHVCHEHICPAEKGRCPITDLGRLVDNSECVLLKADGTQIPIIKTVVPVMLKGRKHLLESFMDITRLKQAEEELRWNEARYRTLVEQAPDGLFVADEHTRRILDVNSAASRMFGYSREEILGLTVVDMVAAEEVPRVASEMAKLQSGETVVSEWRLRRKDGSLFPGEVRAREIPGGRFQGFVHDLTERRRAQDALREASQLNQQIIAGAKEGIIVYDRDLKYQVWNPFMEEMTGIPAAEVIGKQPLEVFPFLQAAGVMKQLNQVLAGNECATKEFPFHVPQTGRSGWASDINSPLRNAKGEIAGVIGVVRNITARKRAEDELRESEERFAFAMEATREGVWDWDVPSGRAYYSPAYYAMLGYSAEEHAADFHSWLDLIHPADRNEALRANHDCIDGRCEHFEVEFRMRSKSGEWKWVAARGKAVARDHQGKATRLVGTHQDITDRKQAEVTLKTSEAALKQAQHLARIGNWEWDVRTGQHTRSEEIYRIYCGAPALPAAIYPKVKKYFTPESWARLAAHMEQALCDGVAFECDVEVVRPDGSRCWITARGEAVRDDTGEIVKLRGTAQDITDRKRTEQLLQNANRTLAAIRDCHEAMLRAKTERGLLDEICRIIVQTGGERMVWVGFAEQNARKTVRPVASAGVSRNYLAKAHITWADTPRGRGPVGTAIRTGKVSLCQNTLTDPNFAPWRAGARRNGYGSVIALPLVVDGQCIGALCIYAAEPNTFDAAEQLMLTDLANDLAFGINTLRLRAERERLEDEILKSVEREQERIGRDLHDGLCQLLVGAKFRSCYLQKLSADKLPAAAREAKALEKTLNHAIEQARDLSRGLNPLQVTPAGLTAALQKLADNVVVSRGPNCICQFPEPVKISDHHVAYHLYRIAQEAVQNALKHARAKNISITLGRQENSVVLAVKDDGVGMARRRKKSGMGLRNMQTRARLIGGRLEIRQRKQGGTAVTCELPEASKPQL